jgi:hypothetical protein
MDVTSFLARFLLTSSDHTSDLVRHYDFPVPDAFLVFNPFQSKFSATRILPSSYLFWAERGWWITCNYPTVLKEKNVNRKSRTRAICWLKSVLHEEKRREQENHCLWDSNPQS